LSATQLNATSNVSGVFVYSPISGTILNVGTSTLSTTFTPTDTINYNVVSDTASIIINSQAAQPSSSHSGAIATTTTTLPQQKTKQEVLIGLVSLLQKLILQYKQMVGSIPKA